MLTVGITGNIGSGKTTVSRLFELLDIPVFYADDQAKLVMVTNSDLIAGIKAAFGVEAYFENGNLNRRHLAARVFNNNAELQKLNALVHPAVFEAFDAWVAQQQAPYILKEAAILFESGSYRDCDYTILVTAPIHLRLNRVVKRDGIAPAEAESRNARQMPEEDKIKLANFVVINNDSQLVIPQVLHLHQQLIQLATLTAK